MRPNLAAPILLVLAVFLGCVALWGNDSTPAQSQLRVTEIRPPEPKFKATFSVDNFQVVELTKDDLKKSVLTHPGPKFVMSFEGTGSDARLAEPLPAEAIKALEQLWTAELSYFYDAKIEGFPNAKTQIERDTAILQKIIGVESLLQKISVKAPDGARQLSEAEAEALTRLLGEMTQKVMSKAKAI